MKTFRNIHPEEIPTDDNIRDYYFQSVLNLNGYLDDMDPLYIWIDRSGVIVDIAFRESNKPEEFPDTPVRVAPLMRAPFGYGADVRMDWKEMMEIMKKIPDAVREYAKMLAENYIEKN